MRYRLLIIEIRSRSRSDVDQWSMTIELFDLWGSRSQVNNSLWNHWAIIFPSMCLVRSHGMLSVLPNLLIKVLRSLCTLNAIEILLSATSRGTSHSWSLVCWLDLFDVWGFCLIYYSCWWSTLVRDTIVSDSWIRYWCHLTGHFFFLINFNLWYDCLNNCSSISDYLFDLGFWAHVHVFLLKLF